MGAADVTQREKAAVEEELAEDLVEDLVQAEGLPLVPFQLSKVLLLPLPCEVHSSSEPLVVWVC